MSDTKGHPNYLSSPALLDAYVDYMTEMKGDVKTRIRRVYMIHYVADPLHKGPHDFTGFHSSQGAARKCKEIMDAYYEGKFVRIINVFKYQLKSKGIIEQCVFMEGKIAGEIMVLSTRDPPLQCLKKTSMGVSNYRAYIKKISKVKVSTHTRVILGGEYRKGMVPPRRI